MQKDANNKDELIGKIIFAIRNMRGLTKTELSLRIGVTSQQLNKYEQGINRLTITRLLDICKALEYDICSFFDIFEAVADSSKNSLMRLDFEKVTKHNVGNNKLSLLELYLTIASIKDENKLLALRGIIKSM